MSVLISHKAYLVDTSSFSRRSYLRSRQSNRICVHCRCILHDHKQIGHCNTLQSNFIR